MFSVKFGLVCYVCCAARVRATLGKDDGKSVRINVPTKLNNLFPDSQILFIIKSVIYENLKMLYI
jgi:hypothetical protein